MSNSEKTILDECLDLFGEDIPAFSKTSGIEYQTLKGWDRRKKVSPLGEIALRNIMQNKKNEDDLADYHELRVILSRITK